MDNFNEDDIRDITHRCVRLDKNSKIKDIALGTTIRYFVKTDEGYKFRTGGTLIDKDGYPKYITLYNRGKTWSVQLATAVLLYELTDQEFMKICKKVNKTQMTDINKLRQKRLDALRDKKKIKYKVKGELVKEFDTLKTNDIIICCHKYQKIKCSGIVYRTDSYRGKVYNINLHLSDEKIVNIDPKFFYIYKVPSTSKEVTVDVKKMYDRFVNFMAGSS